IKATDVIVVNLKGLSDKTKVGRFAITSFLMALATSLPELVVCLAAALDNQSNLALGNVIGSNIADLSLVIGGAALIGGAVAVRGLFLRRDVFYAFLAGSAPMVLLFDKSLTRMDGLILLALYGFYITWVFKERQKRLGKAGDEEEAGIVKRLLRQLSHRGTQKEVVWLFLGVAILLFAAGMIVRLASKMAIALNLPLLLIGLFLVAVGTSLPELAFSLKAIREHESSMVFGDLLGSVVANGTLIIGLVALISPLRIQAFDEYLLATIAFVVIFGIFYLFIRTKHRLERWEGAALFGVYLIFVLLEFLKP
ncbi:MAG: calcium/sodium antiporter, partial [Candidatus Marinimicrobia bacterium]|nr:calcium/sodium antiporter [Candidatus Neomarinimicrobiota bacterium]